MIAVIVDDTRDPGDGAYRRLAAIINRKFRGVGGLFGALLLRPRSRQDRPGTRCGTEGTSTTALPRSPRVWSVIR